MSNKIHLDSLVTAYDAFQAFEERCFAFLHALVDAPEPEYDLPRWLLHTALVRLATGHDMDEAVTDIGWVNEQGDEGDYVVWHANADAYLRFGHLYPPALEALVKTQLTSHSYVLSENQGEHLNLLIAVAGYLVAQTWPKWSAAEEILDRTSAHLQSFFDRVLRQGLGGPDAAIESARCLGTLATLHDFALDARLRHKAVMMLDWFLVRMAGTWENGHILSDDAQIALIPGMPDGTLDNTVGWLYFGGEMPDLEDDEAHGAVINALSGYRPPEIILHIAQDRDWLLDGAAVVSAPGSSVLALRYGMRTRTLDYTAWRVCDGLA